PEQRTEGCRIDVNFESFAYFVVPRLSELRNTRNPRKKNSTKIKRMETASPEPRLPQSPPLAGERLAFTGTLASMTHKEAHARAVEAGGIAAEHVSRQTTML